MRSDEWGWGVSKLGLLWVVISAVLTMLANLLLRAGIDQGEAGTDKLGSLFERYLSWFLQPTFMLGVVFYGLAALTWFRVVASEPLSSAYPVLVGMTFILVLFGAVLCFDEKVTALKAVGSFLILFGIIIISRSGT